MLVEMSHGGQRRPLASTHMSTDDYDPLDATIEEEVSDIAVDTASMDRRLAMIESHAARIRLYVALWFWLSVAGAVVGALLLLA